MWLVQKERKVSEISISKGMAGEEKKRKNKRKEKKKKARKRGIEKK